jgi:PAS domain-containing protein
MTLGSGIQDLKDSKSMEEELWPTKESLSLALELAHLGPWVYHIDKDLFEFNDEFYAIYGTTVSREGRFMAPEVYIREFVHPDDAGIVEHGAQQSLSSHEQFYTFQFEHRIIRRDGAVRILRYGKGLIGTQPAILSNFTERIRMSLRG